LTDTTVLWVIIATSSTSGNITLDTFTLDFDMIVWTLTFWWVVSSFFMTGITIVRVSRTFNTLMRTLATLIIFTFEGSTWTWAVWWILGSVSFTGVTTTSVGTGQTVWSTWFTFWVITIIIVSFSTVTVWFFKSDISTESTVISMTFTSGTWIFTVLTDTIFVGELSVRAVTVWWIVLSGGMTCFTMEIGVIFVGETGQTLDGTWVTVWNTGIIVTSNTDTIRWNTSLWIFTDVTDMERGTGNTVVWTILTDAVIIFIITSGTTTRWSIDSVGITS